MRFKRFPRVIAVLVIAAMAINGPALCRSAEPDQGTKNGSEKNTADHARQVGEEKIRDELKNKTDLKFADVSLADAIKTIADRHHLEIQFDESALNDASVDPQAVLVTAEIRGVSLQAALKAILAPSYLTCEVANEILMITTMDHANAGLSIKIYDLHDLVGRGGPIEGDYDSLISLLTTTIAPSSWDSVGGTGTIQVGPSETLIVSQTSEILEQVSNLISTVGKLAGPNGDGKVGPSVAIGESPADRAIEKALTNKVDLNFKGALLNEVVARLASDTHLNFQIDTAEVKQLAVKPLTVPITQAAKGISLNSALCLILRPLKLSYIIQNEAVLITSGVKAERSLVTRLYPIGDLGDAEELAGNIKSTIFAPYWDEVGGQGTLSVLGEKSSILSISQTQEVHAAIADFLESLRSVIGKQPAHGKTAGIPILVAYDLKTSRPETPTMTPEEVAEVVKGLLATKSWNEPDVYIRGVTGKLIVRQTSEVQRQIEKLLVELGVFEAKPNGGLGGGGF